MADETPPVDVNGLANALEWVKVAGDAATYKTRLEKMAAEGAALEQKRSKHAKAMMDASGQVAEARAAFEKMKIERADLDKKIAAFNAMSAQRQIELERDSERLSGFNMEIKQREAALPDRERIVQSRENGATERETNLARKEAEAESIRRQYEVKMQKLAALAN